MVSLTITMFVNVIKHRVCPATRAATSNTRGVFVALSAGLVPVPLITNVVVTNVLTTAVDSSSSCLLVTTSTFTGGVCRNLVGGSTGSGSIV